MTDYLGSAAVLNWIWSGGTQALNSDFRAFTFTPMQEKYDVTAGADANKSYLRGTKDFTASLQAMAQAAGTALEDSLALGNVVGSNIYNVLGILGVTALIHPVAAPAEIVAFDNWVMLAATALLIFFATTQSRFTRLEGGLMVAGYAAYIGWLALHA